MKKPIVKKKYYNDILTFKRKGRPVRAYGRKVDFEFAKEYLKNGGDKEVFKNPENIIGDKKEKTKDKTEREELKKEAKELGIKISGKTNEEILNEINENKS